MVIFIAFKFMLVSYIYSAVSNCSNTATVITMVVMLV